MKLSDLVTAPWAITPDKLLEMAEIYATHLRGEKIDIEAIEARLGRPLANEQQEYTLREGGVAVLPIEGVLAPKANLFTRISGGASAQMLRMQLESAMADSRVKSIVLAIDSPGGSVFGGPELAAAVHAFAQEKPIVATSDGQMASMAYWIGSAANAAFVSGPTVMAGSIGVVMTHQFSPTLYGRTTEITAGKYKRIATSNAPLSKEGAAYLQAQVDHLYSVFVDAVAQHRGVTADDVLEHMADGRVFIGQQAIDAGLVDGVATVDALVEQLAADPQRYAKRVQVAMPAKKEAGAASDAVPPLLAEAGAADESASPTPTREGPPVMSQATTPAALTREALERDHPALFASLRAEFTAAGAAAELSRVQAVREAALPGHEALIERLAADGKTSGAEAAQQVLAAERTARTNAAAAHAADAPQAAPSAAAAAANTQGDKTAEQKVAEAQAYAAQHGVDLVAAMEKLGITVDA